MNLTFADDETLTKQKVKTLHKSTHRIMIHRLLTFPNYFRVERLDVMTIWVFPF